MDRASLAMVSGFRALSTDTSSVPPPIPRREILPSPKTSLSVSVDSAVVSLLHHGPYLNENGVSLRDSACLAPHSCIKIEDRTRVLDCPAEPVLQLSAHVRQVRIPVRRTAGNRRKRRVWVRQLARFTIIHLPRLAVGCVSLTAA